MEILLLQCPTLFGVLLLRQERSYALDWWNKFKNPTIAMISKEDYTIQIIAFSALVKILIDLHYTFDVDFILKSITPLL